jgi:hypothetical protein
MILIGSRATAFHYRDARIPNDWDIVATMEEIMTWVNIMGDDLDSLEPSSPYKMKAWLVDKTQIEFEVVDEENSNHLLVKMAGAWDTSFIPGRIQTPVASPAVLYYMKDATVRWPVHWFKTIEDLHFLRSNGAVETPSDLEREFGRLRRLEADAKYGKRSKPNLDMSNDAFFAKSQASIGRVHVHDDIHEAVAYGERPLFEAFKPDLNKASLSKKMFEAGSAIDQLRLVREEAMVIALERYIVPHLDTKPLSDLTEQDAISAYQNALRRISTNLTSGWFRDFAIANWPKIKLPDRDYLELYRLAFKEPSP